MTDDSGIRIRLAQPQDAAALAEFGERTFAIAFGPENTAQDLQDYLVKHYGPDIQAREIADVKMRTLLAEQEGKMVGYVQLRLNSTHSSFAAVAPIELWRIYIEPDRKGTGLAQLIMEAARNEARALGGDVLWLSVWKNNPRAIAFYRKEGFEIVGEKDFWVGTDQQFDFVMSAELEPKG